MESLNCGGEDIIMMIEKEGWCFKMFIPNSTIAIRWPLPGDGYMIIVSSIVVLSPAYDSKRKIRQVN